VRTIGYYTGRRKEALDSIARIVPEGDRATVLKRLVPYRCDLDELGAMLTMRIRREAEQKAKEAHIALSVPGVSKDAASCTSGNLVPHRTIFGTLTLEGIPPETWVGVKRSLRWWNAKNWATAAWWCDGVRNLDTIRELMGYEADRPVSGFDLEAYFRFLENQGLVEFVK